MVRWIFEKIAAPVRGLHQAAYLLAALTLVSQILALLRDRTFAHTFGLGEILDLYYAAFRVPDLVLALISSLVSAFIIIPRITGMDKEETKRLLSESATFLLGVGGMICLILAIFMPQFLTFLYPNLVTSVHNSEFILLSRILLIQPILLGLSSLLSSVTQIHRRFTLFALSPVLYNLGIIGGAFFLYPIWGLLGIGAGVIIGSIAYVAVNIYVVIEAGVVPSFRIPTFSLMAPIVRDSLPRSLALGVGAVTALALTAIASRLGTGSVSVLSFASNLQSVPLALIGASYAVAAFPALSEAVALEKRDEFYRILSSSARHIILWSMVSLGLILVLRAHLVRVVLGTGAFDWGATRMTAALLAIFAVGLAAQGLAILFSRALYAARQSWRPLFYQLISGIFTVLLAIALIDFSGNSVGGFLNGNNFLQSFAAFLRVADVPGTNVLLIAFASTIGQIFLAIISLIALSGITHNLIRPLFRTFIDGCIAAFFGGLAAYVTLAFGVHLASLTTLISVFTQGFIAGIIGLLVSGMTLFLIENEEFSIVVSAIKKLIHTYSGVLSPSADESIRP